MNNKPGIRICSHCNKAQEITADEGWICGKCTLQNGPHSNICLACDAPKQLAICHQSDDDESTVSAEQSDGDQSGEKEWVCDKCTFINEPQAIVCECRRTKIMAMGGWECKSCGQPVSKMEEKCDCGRDKQGRVDRLRRGKNKTTKQQISEDADQADQETGPHDGAPGEDGEENCDMEVEAEDAEHNEQATATHEDAQSGASEQEGACDMEVETEGATISKQSDQKKAHDMEIEVGGIAPNKRTAKARKSAQQNASEEAKCLLCNRKLVLDRCDSHPDRLKSFCPRCWSDNNNECRQLLDEQPMPAAINTTQTKKNENRQMEIDVNRAGRNSREVMEQEAAQNSKSKKRIKERDVVKVREKEERRPSRPKTAIRSEATSMSKNSAATFMNSSRSVAFIRGEGTAAEEEGCARTVMLPLEQLDADNRAYTQWCALCGQVADKQCARCKRVFYCSKEHQIVHWESHKARCLTPAGETCKYCRGAVHPSEDGPLGICPCSSPREWCGCEPRCIRDWVCKCGETILCTVIFDEHRAVCQDGREEYFADIRARFGEVVATREERLNRIPALSNVVVDDHERWAEL